MNIDFFTDKIIIMNFPAFSGGKFIINCLALSKHATPQNTKITNYLKDNPTDYNYRLSAVLSTLPPLEDIKNWRQKWEFGDTDFYNGSVENCLHRWKQGILSNNSVNQTLSALISKNICFFMTAHGGISEVENIISVWPNARIITLINSEKFWRTAINLKQNNITDPSFGNYAGNECQDKYQLLKGKDWPDWNLFEKCHYNIDTVSKYVIIKQSVKKEIKQFYRWHTIKNNTFWLDVDNSFFDKQLFLTKVHELYNWIGFDDFNPSLIEQYYMKYIALHTQQTN
jgi:hypothetical protein